MEGDFVKSSGNVFADLGFDAEEAANLKLRTKLAILVRRYIKEEGLRQAEAAERFGVSQAEISNLVNRKIDKVSIDKLVNMLAKVGIGVDLQVKPSEEPVGELEPA